MTKVLWTDGSADPNPGPGGFAVIENGRPVRLGRADFTTNNRMEGEAIIAAIEYANGEYLELHTDSQFWKNVLEKWAPNWKRNNWLKRGGKIKNLELVQKAYKLYKSNPVKIVWVRGHSGTMSNELADEWAKRARGGAEL